MKTFNEFISERYYEPHEPLPSGKTPYGKATSSYYRQKGEYFRGGRKNPKHYDRVLTQIQRRNNQVRRGADNPDFDWKPDKSGRYDVRTDTNYSMSVRDTKNDLEMRVRQKDQIAPGRKPVYDVEWYNLSGRRNHNPGQARGVVKSVADMWKNQVAPRIPSNVVLTNFPLSNDTSDRNTRSKLYSKVAGFGEKGRLGRQYANVGRNPSPKQAAKGAQRITPLPGDLDPDYVYSHRELNNLRTPHKPAGMWAATERATGQRRQIAPAKPSRPLQNQALKALKSTAPMKAPTVAKPVAPKPVAKPAAPKPVAKPAAPKPVAKPAAPKPVAKPTAKPLVSKIVKNIKPPTIKPPAIKVRGGGRAALAAGIIGAGLAAYSALRKNK